MLMPRCASVIALAVRPAPKTASPSPLLRVARHRARAAWACPAGLQAEFGQVSAQIQVGGPYLRPQSESQRAVTTPSALPRGVDFRLGRPVQSENCVLEAEAPWSERAARSDEQADGRLGGALPLAPVR
jgi:hypothetical protein